MRSYKVGLGMVAMSLLGAGLSACQSPAANPDLGKTADLRRPADLAPAIVKGVYTASNDVNGNQIFAYARAADGSLTALNAYSTGGVGTGASLGDQNSLIFDSAQNLFYVVNGGDNTISMMSLKPDGSLALLFAIYSGGSHPVSITESGGVVYVVNQGSTFAAGNITGFQVSGDTLVPIANSTKPLSAMMVGAAQIQFAPGGALLVVTEKTTSKIDTYTVASGVATGPMAQPSNGTTPYGFAFSASQKLIVSEAAAGGQSMGASSSYSISPTGVLTSVSNHVTSAQTSPCWVAVSGNNAFVSNSMSNNITAYSVATDGTLGLLANGNSGTTGMGPTDIAVTEANDYLYVLNSKDHSLSIFGVNAAGTLTKKPDFTGLPPFAEGLVAR